MQTTLQRPHLQNSQGEGDLEEYSKLFNAKPADKPEPDFSADKSPHHQKSNDFIRKIVICMRDQVAREGLRYIFNDHPRFNVAAVAETGEEFVEMCLEHRPNAALIEWAGAPIQTAMTIKKTVELLPDSNILVFSPDSAADVVTACIDAGARGFYSRDVPLQMLTGALLMVARGSLQFSPNVQAQLINPYPIIAPKIEKIYDQLTDREGDVLQLMAKGFSNRQIAEKLVIGLGTVKNHVSHILSKLGVEDRTQAVVMALRGELDN